MYKTLAEQFCDYLDNARELRAVEVRMETRTVAAVMELRDIEGKGRRLVGHAAVFDSPSELIGGMFREYVKPGAFAETLGADVRALINHNPSLILGRNKAGTLALREDAKGLAIEVDLPDTTYARDLAVSIQRGDVTQMSFAFETLDDTWRMEDGVPTRDLVKVRLSDVSAVTYPAYPDTAVAVRSCEKWKATLPPSVAALQALQRQKEAECG